MNDPVYRAERPPALRRRYLIPESVIDNTTEFLRLCGEEQLEGVVVWIGRLVEPLTAEVVYASIPRQIAYRSQDGVAVEVPPEGISELISSLSEGHSVLIRVHSHPGPAYHSRLDDTNMLISHGGAISIVVPTFAAAGVDLVKCSVNQLEHGRGWIELDPQEVRRRFEVV